MISVKNACTNGWFSNGDCDELLKMAKELLSSFCMGMSFTSEASTALATISKVILRFYPQFKLGDLLLSFEAKSGYDVLISDFQVKKCKTPGEMIRLFVVQTDNLETSSCLISPPQVSFLVNGKGIAGRTNVFLDTGPQFPTDITKMLKQGTNIIQAAGYFSGNCIITVAFTSTVPVVSQKLQDYVQPVSQVPESDPDITVGTSRISLNCPISFRRIKTPAKGHLCKHYQTFDYDNFLEMNLRKPSWRCPSCNQPTSFIDLRIDQNMVKILKDVAVDVTDVFISVDGSWKLNLEQDVSADHTHEEELVERVDTDVVGKSNVVSDAVENVMDLTMDEDGWANRIMSEGEDRKLYKDLQASTLPESISEHLAIPHTTDLTRGVSSPLGSDMCIRTLSAASASISTSMPAIVLDTPRVGTLESLVPTSVLSPVAIDAFSTVTGQNSMVSLLQQVSSVRNPAQVSQFAEGIQIQMPTSRSSTMSSEAYWRPVIRQTNGGPIAAQVLPARSQAPSSCQWMQSHLLSSSERIDTDLLRSGSTIATCTPVALQQRVPSVTSIPDRDIDMLPLSSTSEIIFPAEQLHSMTQNQDHISQYTPGSAFQSADMLATPTQGSSSIQQLGGYREPLQPLSDHQTPFNQFLNLRGPHQTLSHCTNANQSSPSQNSSCIAGGNLADRYRRLLDAQRATMLARLRSVNHSSSTPVTPDEAIYIGVPQLQNNRPPTVPRSEGLPNTRTEQNWQPTGRMRGSLTGAEFSTALSHYLARTATPSTSATSGHTMSGDCQRHV